MAIDSHSSLLFSTVLFLAHLANSVNGLTSVELGLLATSGVTTRVQSPDTVLFDNNATSCGAPTTSYTITLTASFIVTGVFDDAHQKTAPVNVGVAVGAGATVSCAEVGTACADGVYGDKIQITSSASFTLCELLVTGFEKPPPVIPSNVTTTYFFTTQNGEFTPYLRLEWPYPPSPKIAKFKINQELANSGTGETLDNSTSFFGQTLLDLLINREGFYNVSITSVFESGSSPEIESLTSRFTISRGPLCWAVGECADSNCVDTYKSTFVRVIGKTGVCLVFYSSDYSNGTMIEPPTQDYMAYFNGALVQSSRPSINIPTGPANQSKCFDVCFGALHSYVFGRTTPLPGDSFWFPRQCSLMTRLYCCSDEDYCFSPDIWAAHNTTLDQSCARILSEYRGADFNYEPFLQCLYPKPFEAQSFTGDSVHLKFHVPKVINYTSITLRLTTAADHALVRSGDICKPASAFQGGNYFTCDINELDAGTSYFAHLTGQTQNTLESFRFKFTPDARLTVDCQQAYYTLGFHFTDIPTTQITYNEENITTSTQSGTAFNDQTDQIQVQWADNTFQIPVSTTKIFRGFPNMVSVQNDSSKIVALYFTYQFQTSRIIHGNETLYNSNSVQSFSLVNERIIQVKGSFNNGVLQSIQFTKKALGGATTESPCYGPTGSTCGGFKKDPPHANQTVVGFYGEVNAIGEIVSLGLIWVGVDYDQFSLLDGSCLMEEKPDWNDIDKFSFSHNVTGFSTCGTIQIFDIAKNKVNYENRISAFGVGGAINGTGVQITRNNAFTLQGHCTYDAKSIVHSGFKTKSESAISVTGLNKVNFELLIYTDNTYSTSYNPDSLVTLLVNNRFYFGVKFDVKQQLNDMHLLAFECYAKKDSDPDISAANAQYFMIEDNGCAAASDPSFERVEARRTNTFDPLSAVAFKWVTSPGATIYLHCRVRACPSQNATLCQARSSLGTCNSNNPRARRGVDLLESEGHPEMVQQIVSSQPIFFQASNYEIIYISSKRFLDSYTQTSVVFLLAMLVCVAKMGHSVYRRTGFGRRFINSALQRQHKN